jgi:acyl-coenzyme A synthetase/AMP-(fatty) acid ligase
VDGVKEAVCFGVEDAKYGEIVWAGVVLDEKAKGRVGKEEEERIKKALEGKIAPVRSFLLSPGCFLSSNIS